MLGKSKYDGWKDSIDEENLVSWNQDVPVLFYDLERIRREKYRKKGLCRGRAAIKRIGKG
jgi:hypothetical protein